jgi:hypothetical protein
MTLGPAPTGTRRVYVHAHVPKNAGSSFDKLLHRNFRWRFARDYPLLETLDTRHRADDFGRVLDLHPFLRAYASHRVSTDLPFDRPDLDLVCVAFVRDPVDRFLSHYFFARSCPSYYSRLAKRVSLREYIQLTARGELHAPGDTVHTAYACSQTKFLANETGPAAVARLADLCERGRLLLLPSERFADACLMLEALFPDQFRDMSSSGRRNASRPDQPILPEDREAIRELVADDFAVLELARQTFARRFDDLLPGKVADRRRAGLKWRNRMRATVAAVGNIFRRPRRRAA